MSHDRRRATTGWCAVGVVLVSFGSLLADEPAVPKPPGAGGPVVLSQVPTEDLLKQALTLHDKAAHAHRAQLRELATAQRAWQEAVKRSDDAERTGRPPAPGDATATEPKVDAARARQGALARRLELVVAERSAIDRLLAAADLVQAAARAYLDALDDLAAYGYEIELRVGDGSLAADQVPPALGPAALSARRKELLDQAGRDPKRADELRAALVRTDERRDLARKALADADAGLALATKASTQEQRRQAIMKGFTDKPIAVLAAELDRMVEEGVALKGAFDLSRHQFASRLAKAAALRAALEATEPRANPIPPVARAEDIEPAAQATRAQIAHFAARATAIANVRAALDELGKQGAELEGDAAVVAAHLFETEVLAAMARTVGGSGTAIPREVEGTRLRDDLQRVADATTAALALVEQAKAELVQLDQQLADTRAAEEEGAKRLDALVRSQGTMHDALAWDASLRGKSAPEAVALFEQTSAELQAVLKQLVLERDAFRGAIRTADEVRVRIGALEDPFVRAAEERGRGDRARIVDDLRNEAGLERVATPPASPPAAPADSEAPPSATPPPAAAPGPAVLDAVARSLVALQRMAVGRVRVKDEQEQGRSTLLEAIGTVDQRIATYTAAMAQARALERRLRATAIDLKKRVGRGELAGEAVPDGVTHALRHDLPASLDAEISSVLGLQAQLAQERERLVRPDPAGASSGVVLAEVLTLIGQRLDLLADLAKLDETDRLAATDRAPAETKRLEQMAADRQATETSWSEWLASIDASRKSQGLSALLETYYRELVEIEEREAGLGRQRAKIVGLVELAHREATAIAELSALIAGQTRALEAAREEELVLARARLRPSAADALLRDHQARTGRVVARPPPIPDPDKAERIEELARALFDREVQVEASRRWAQVLDERASGLAVELGAYQDYLARLNGDAAAHERRIATLTGAAPPSAVPPATPVAADAGAIGETRRELLVVRRAGVFVLGAKMGLVVVAALVLPGLFMRMMRRIGGRGDTHLILSSLSGLTRVIAWIVAVAIIFSMLGFDVTAILAGLGIGGLALGLAAQPLIADLISTTIIFIEQRFKIGDVIRIGDDEPAKVIGISWRMTQLRTPDDLVVNIPNRRITEAGIQNRTREGRTYDSIEVAVSTSLDVDAVLAVVREAMDECKNLWSTADRGTSVHELEQHGAEQTIKYRVWWYLRDFDLRNQTRDEVFARVSKRLASEDLAGTRITLA